MRLAYDGTDFAGYQVQPGERTVQGVVESALAAMHGGPIGTSAAGRTDSGVHATGQYVAFMTDLASIPEERWVAALNGHLPRDVRVQAARFVPPEFHARFSARRRHYRYRILEAEADDPLRRRYVHRIPWQIDIAAINAEAATLVGTHDFATFAAAGGEGNGTVRTVYYADFRRLGDEVVFAICANGFLWHMVRSIVGTLLQRDRDRRRSRIHKPTFADLLEARDRTGAGTTAPAHALCLTGVDYD